jgi:hypothetical protein
VPGEESERRAVPSDVRHRRAHAGEEIGGADRERRRDGGDEQGDGGSPPTMADFGLRANGHEGQDHAGHQQHGRELGGEGETQGRAQDQAAPRRRSRGQRIGRGQGQEVEQREGHVHRGQASVRDQVRIERAGDGGEMRGGRSHPGPGGQEHRAQQGGEEKDGGQARGETEHTSPPRLVVAGGDAPSQAPRRHVEHGDRRLGLEVLVAAALGHAFQQQAP